MRYPLQALLTLMIVAIAASVASADPATRTAGSKIEGNYTGSRPRMVYRTYRAAPRTVVSTTTTAPAQATAAAPAAAPATAPAPVAKAPAAPAQVPAVANRANGATRSFSYQPQAGTATTAPARTYYYSNGHRFRGPRWTDASRKPLGEY